MGLNDKNFQVDLAAGMSTTIKLDSKGRATLPITVKNLTNTTIDGRGVLISIPITQPPSGAVEKKMVTIDGSDTRNFAVDQEQLFNIKVAVPSNSPQGDYSFRADFVNVAHTDWGGDSSPVFKFRVDAPPPPKKIPWLWIGIVAAVVLLIGGVTTALLLRKPTPGPNPTPSPTPVATPNATPTPTPNATPNPTPNPSPLGGTWVNDNPNTGGLTRLLITQNGNSVSVHAFGKCSPTDCDWGSQGGTGSTNNSAVVIWNQGFVVRTMTLQALPTGHLNSTLVNHFNDSRGVTTTFDSFHRLEIVLRPFTGIVR